MTDLETPNPEDSKDLDFSSTSEEVNPFEGMEEPNPLQNNEEVQDDEPLEVDQTPMDFGA